MATIESEWQDVKLMSCRTKTIVLPSSSPARRNNRIIVTITAVALMALEHGNTADFDAGVAGD